MSFAKLKRHFPVRWSTTAGLSLVSSAAIAAPAMATPPTIYVSGPAVERAWVGGSPSITVQATNEVNSSNWLTSLDAYLDNHQFVSQVMTRYTGASAANTHLPASLVPDGAHTLSISANNQLGERSTYSRTVRVDNHPPGAPENLTVAGGTGWRALPGVQASWTIPPQRFAPVAATHYRLCPADASSNDPDVAARARAKCAQGALSGTPLTKLPPAFRLPEPGLWTLQLWLVDAAGNAAPDSAATISVGFDPTPPRVAGFVGQDPKDPARVSVAAFDGEAPITGGSIEVRRRGTNVWRPLRTEVTPRGLAALIDDETLRRGRYALRATVINAAGLQHGTDRGADGAVKSLQLPIRLGSRLQAGRRVGKVCRRQGDRRRCSFKLARRVPVELGRPITLRGRLQSGGKPVANQPLELWQRLSVAGAHWTQVGAVATNGRGRVRYKAPPGPARKLRFRYPGTPHVRGDDATIALDVQAKTTIDVSRRNVINGEYVIFRGRLKSRPIPAEGALVELQVRSRGKWRTFAQPRANAKGAWQYQYRFETVRGGARYRFRARVRRQAGYPYATGSSREIAVRVHGL